MLGTVPAERIPSLYAESDVAVVMLRNLPIFEGALPTKLLEAMAAARPVVLAARGEAARLVTAEGCGFGRPAREPERSSRGAGDARRRPRAACRARHRRAACG